MARKAKKPLDGCLVALTGRLIGQNGEKYTRNMLKNKIYEYGGDFTRRVTDAEYLVSSKASYESLTPNVAAALENKKTNIMKLKWLEDLPSERKDWFTDAYCWFSAVADRDQQESNQPIDQSATYSSKVGNPKNTRKSTKVKAGVKVNSETTNTSNITAEICPKAKVRARRRPNKLDAKDQPIKKKDVVIPLDEHCTLPTYQVYVDPDTGLIYDASLNQTDSSANKNKFYRIQVLKDPKSSDFKTWTRWGRVGETGQKAILGNGTLDDAIKQFQKKFKDKSGLTWCNRTDTPKPGKYTFVERSYNPDSDDDDDDEDDMKAVKKAVKKQKREDENEASPPECTLKKPVKELMELIFNQQYFQEAMTSLNYNAKQLPLGKLSKTTILRGFQQLKDLAALIDDPTLASSKWKRSMDDATEHLSNTYYSFIPHVFGRNRPPIIGNNDILKKEIELLESLSDMKDAEKLMKIDRKTRDIIHPLDRQFQGLGLKEMTVLDHQSSEFKHLKDYLNESRGSTHRISYNVKEIFRIERQGELKRFSKFSKIPSDRRLLWHGSRATNYGGILSQGLRIAPPEAPVSGYMFGKGIYLADRSSKSAGYCCFGTTGGEALLLLCEAELGDPIQKLTQPSYNAGTDAKKKGMYSTWGQGRTGPSKWVDASIVHPDLKDVKMPDLQVKPDPKVKPSKNKAQDIPLEYN
ncbi:hypothetical protein IL306_005387, partial [Fusarium sp. DS 682]